MSLRMQVLEQELWTAVDELRKLAVCATKIPLNFIDIAKQMLSCDTDSVEFDLSEKGIASFKALELRLGFQALTTETLKGV